MDIYSKLKEAGLTGNESKVYLELISKGNLSANQTAKNIGMDRTLTYTVLNHLIEKGQVSYVVIGKKKVFSVAPPENLMNSVKIKELLIKELVNDLSKIKPTDQDETGIRVYEGKEGIRAFVNLAFKKGDFCAFGSTGRTYYALYEMPALAKELKKRKIKVRLIGNTKLKGTEVFNFDFIDCKYWDVESESTTTIFRDCIAIHLLKEKPILILIENKHIAQSYKNYFEWMWKKAES